MIDSPKPGCGKSWKPLDPMHVPQPESLSLAPRKAPRQSRSRLTVDAIVIAAQRILQTQSLDALNTNRVAEIAGVSVGSLYQYFPNKDALVVELIRRAHDELLEGMLALSTRTQGLSFDDTLRAVIALIIAKQYGNPLYAAALDRAERRLPLEDYLREFHQSLGGIIQALFARHLDVIALDLPDSAAATAS
jgi:AcrR family transcriptional regulator